MFSFGKVGESNGDPSRQEKRKSVGGIGRPKLPPRCRLNVIEERLLTTASSLDETHRTGQRTKLSPQLNG